MYNWSVNEEKFKKRYPKKYKIWRIAQLINYGLDREKTILKPIHLKFLEEANKVSYITKNFY